MYDHYRATGRSPLTIAYFMFLFIFGNLILLNLFLAILLKNFEEPPGTEEHSEVETIQKVSFVNRIKNYFTSCCFKSKLVAVDETENCENDVDDNKNESNEFG